MEEITVAEIWGTLDCKVKVARQLAVYLSDPTMDYAAFVSCAALSGRVKRDVREFNVHWHGRCRVVAGSLEMRKTNRRWKTVPTTNPRKMMPANTFSPKKNRISS